MTEATSVARRLEERGEGRCRGRERRERGEEEEREAFPPASPRNGISVERERARGRERNREKKEKLRRRGEFLATKITSVTRRERKRENDGELFQNMNTRVLSEPILLLIPEFKKLSIH